MAIQHPGPPPRRTTARSLPVALLRARDRVMQPFRPVLAEAGVTEAQWRVLRVLDEVGSTDATEIAQNACLLMPSLTRILQGLEARGLTARRPHPHDRRKQVVSLTGTGAALVARHLDETMRILAALERDFGTERVEALLDLLERLAAMRGAEDDQAPPAGAT